MPAGPRTHCPPRSVSLAPGPHSPCHKTPKTCPFLAQMLRALCSARKSPLHKATDRTQNALHGVLFICQRGRHKRVRKGSSPDTADIYAVSSFQKRTRNMLSQAKSCRFQSSCPEKNLLLQAACVSPYRTGASLTSFLPAGRIRQKKEDKGPCDIFGYAQVPAMSFVQAAVQIAVHQQAPASAFRKEHHAKTYRHDDSCPTFEPASSGRRTSCAA